MVIELYTNNNKYYVFPNVGYCADDFYNVVGRERVCDVSVWVCFGTYTWRCTRIGSFAKLRKMPFALSKNVPVLNSSLTSYMWMAVKWMSIVTIGCWYGKDIRWCGSIQFSFFLFKSDLGMRRLGNFMFSCSEKCLGLYK